MGVTNKDKWIAKEGNYLSEGYIAVQAESHPIDFKNIELLNLCGCTDSKAANYKTYFVKSFALGPDRPPLFETMQHQLSTSLPEDPTVLGAMKQGCPIDSMPFPVGASTIDHHFPHGQLKSRIHGYSWAQTHAPSA